MESAPYLLQTVLRSPVILVLSLAVFAQIPAVPDSSVHRHFAFVISFGDLTFQRTPHPLAVSPSNRNKKRGW